MKLDAKTVAALDAGGKADAIFFDEAMPGFGLRLQRSRDGTRYLRRWIVQYRRSGGTRRITLGSTDVLGAEAARAAAKKLLAKVALGEDPSSDRRDRRDKDKLSLRGVVEQYLASKRREIRPKTLREVTRYLSGPYFRPLHGMAVDRITRKDVASRLVSISHEHGNTVAAKARDTLSAFFVWCMQMGIAESNPVVGTKKPEGNPPRERVLTDAELAAIWRACGDDHYGKIIRLLILLGQRRSEIGGLAWSELDPFSVARGCCPQRAPRTDERIRYR